MKNLFYGLVAMLLFSFDGNAQEKIDFDQKAEFLNAKIVVKSLHDSSSFTYNSLQEFNEGSEILLKDFNFKETQQGKVIVDKCEVTIEVSITVGVGVASVTVSGEITTTCENAAAAVRKLRTMLMAAALGG